MSSTTVSIIAGVILLAVVFVIAKLAVRWAVRVAMVIAVLAALLSVAGFWWWTNDLAAKPSTRRPAATPTKRSANR
ncbi:MAG TPA: hypothetical protein VIW64_07255 [Pyrinomonadaceae bacterium]|jgi:energy-coupling factor transporter transmembrane protein EcfT